jgi:phosphatidylserine/phosphatidylglycerophosphate/cardiolipin synthase-like enzyme
LNETVAVVGSSNVSLAGLRDNTELNVVVHSNGNPEQLLACRPAVICTEALR